jgi:uncharacterized repeat protein (TIGR01451 family)
MRQRLLSFMSVAGLIASMLIVTGTALAANPAADLDQCANGSVTSPDPTPCQSASEWVNGNLGGSKAHYNEGDSVPYRLRFSNLSLAPAHTVIIEWDTTKGGKHALDYLTTFNRTVGSGANATVGVNPSPGSTADDFTIPADPQVTGAGVTPVAGVFKMWGGDITGVVATVNAGYSYPNGIGFAGDKTARIAIKFTASVANPVLAWGGHIATRVDWGNLNSAVAITGSPYHMRLVSLDGTGGNQDRSLSNDAVIFPGSITIIKDAQPNSAQDFAFTDTGGLTPTSFNLDDDSNGDLSNTRVFGSLTAFGQYTVTEASAANWDLTAINCTVDVNNGGGGSGSVSTRTATINLAEGENRTCTFINQPTPAPHLSIVKDATETSYGAVGDVIHYSITATNDGNTTIAAVTITDANAVLGTCTPANGSSRTPGQSITCSATHTITQADIDAGSYLNTACVDDGVGTGGAAQACDDATVNASKNPALSIVKTTTFVGKYDAGDTLHYNITVTNTGNVTLNNVVVTDLLVGDLACDPGTTVASLAPGGAITCTASYAIQAGDLGGSVTNEACADDGNGDGDPGADAVCDDVSVNSKAQPTIVTADKFIPQDSITMSGLTTSPAATGTLYVELRINETCGQDASPAYSKSWTGTAFTGNGTYDTDNTVAVSTDATIRWCSSYSGDANNAERPLSSRGEISSIDFDPVGISFIGGGAFSLVGWALWSRRRREDEKGS